VTLWAWLTLLPVIGFFPHISHTLAILFHSFESSHCLTGGPILTNRRIYWKSVYQNINLYQTKNTFSRTIVTVQQFSVKNATGLLRRYRSSQ
jgi:hypothetical protein